MPAEFGRMIAVGLALLGLTATACSSSATEATTPSPTPATEQPTTSEQQLTPAAPTPTPETPGGFEFDRSDPVGGVANIAAAFGTDEATAQCIYDAWGDVANVPAEQLTLELMNFPVCGTSIFQLMTGDPRFTGRSDDE